MGQEEYSELCTFLARFIRRLKTIKAAEGVCMATTCLVLLFALGPAVQRIKESFPYAPLLYTLFAAVLMAALATWMLYEWVARTPLSHAARRIEEKYPHLRNNLINSLELFPEVARTDRRADVSTSMILALLRTTRRQIRDLRLDDLLDRSGVKRQLRLAGAVSLPFLGAVALHPASLGETVSLFRHPLKDIPAAVTTLDVTPKDPWILRGADVTIQAAAVGAKPASVHLAVAPTDDADPQQNEETTPMERSAEGIFSLTLKNVQRPARYRAVAGSFSSTVHTLQVVDAPEVADLRVTLFPPDYVRLPAKTTAGGNIEGMKGSSLRLEAATTKEVVQARLRFDSGKEIPMEIDGRRLQASLILFEPQKYEIVVEDAHGFRNVPIAYEMKVSPDGFPTVELLLPRENLDVNGDEVLPLEFTARDDFGLREIAIAVKSGERQERIVVEQNVGRRLVVRERFAWDLSKLARPAGNDVIYQLEVLDNDTISGPKRGLSRPLRLTFKNLKAEHKQVIEMIHALSERMIDLLADHLERPQSKPERPTESEGSFERKIDDALAEISAAMRRSEQDRLSNFATWSDLEALSRNLRFTKEELLAKEAAAEERARLHDEITAELERMSILSEEIHKRLRAQEVASTAQDLLKSQERLLDALDKLKSGDQNLDGVLQELSRLAKTLDALQQELSRSAARLPEEFLNSDALKGLSFADLFSALDELRQKLARGDIEGALDLARELFNQLASMVAALRGTNQSALASAGQRMQGEMSRSTNELAQIAREQQEILIGTEGVNRKSSAAREGLTKNRVEEFHAGAYESLARLTHLFPDEEEGHGRAASPSQGIDDATVNNLLKEMTAQLLKKDFARFGEILAMARQETAKRAGPEQAERAREAQSRLRELADALEALLSEREVPLQEADKKSLRDLSHRQGALAERARMLHERLDSLLQLFPSLDPRITKSIREAAGYMDSAQGRLSSLDGKGAIPPEREALDRLTQSQQRMESSMQQLAQRGQLGQMATAQLFRYGRFPPYGSLTPLPGMPEITPFEVEGGLTGLDTERFRLPGKDDYRAPRTFREEIIEALKQGVPPQFKDQVESYFKNLSE
jgi:hypothetical protein